MEDLNRFITSTKNSTDLEIENSLRPRSMKDYVGQEKIKNNLNNIDNDVKEILEKEKYNKTF